MGPSAIRMQPAGRVLAIRGWPVLGLRHQPSPGSSACLSGAQKSSSVPVPQVRLHGDLLAPRRERSSAPTGSPAHRVSLRPLCHPSRPNLRLCPLPCLRNLAASHNHMAFPGVLSFPHEHASALFSPSWLPAAALPLCSVLHRPVLSPEGRIDPTRTPAERKGASEERSRCSLTQLQL